MEILPTLIRTGHMPQGSITRIQGTKTTAWALSRANRHYGSTIPESDSARNRWWPLTIQGIWWKPSVNRRKNTAGRSWNEWEPFECRLLWNRSSHQLIGQANYTYFHSLSGGRTDATLCYQAMFKIGGKILPEKLDWFFGFGTISKYFAPKNIRYNCRKCILWKVGVNKSKTYQSHFFHWLKFANAIF